MKTKTHKVGAYEVEVNEKGIVEKITIDFGNNGYERRYAYLPAKSKYDTAWIKQENIKFSTFKSNFYKGKYVFYS